MGASAGFPFGLSEGHWEGVLWVVSAGSEGSALLRGVWDAFSALMDGLGGFWEGRLRETCVDLRGLWVWAGIFAAEPGFGHIAR